MLLNLFKLKPGNKKKYNASSLLSIFWKSISDNSDQQPLNVLLLFVRRTFMVHFVIVHFVVVESQKT